MIGKLKGVVDSTGEDWVVVDVGGVGYTSPVRDGRSVRFPRPAVLSLFPSRRKSATKRSA